MAAYKRRLQKNYQAILRDLEPRKLVNILYQEEVFDDDDMEEVKCEKTRKKKAEVLLAKVKLLEDSEVATVVDSLRQTQRHLYELLQTPVQGEAEALRRSQVQVGLGPSMKNLTSGMTGLHMYQEHPTCVPKVLSPTASEHPPQLGNTETGAVYSQSSDDRLNPPPRDEEPPFVNPTDLAKILPQNMPGSDLVYPMSSKPRGITLIINNEKFKHSTESTENEQKQEELDVRLGSNEDVAALEKLFGALDFKVKTERNKGRKDILKLLDEVSHYDHKDYDCFVLWLMSHGQEGQFYGADGKTVPIETVRDFFSNARCSTLKGKPKIIFIQACRGREKEQGVVADAPQSPTEHGEEPSTHEDEESSDVGFNFKLNEAIPEHADMLIANSTISGYASFRNPKQGSRFVRCVVEVFREYACHEDLLSMLTMVNQRVGKMGEIGTKQVSEPAYTLRKKLFFWPGL